jgi:hypothetical protein
MQRVKLLLGGCIAVLVGVLAPNAASAHPMTVRDPVPGCRADVSTSLFYGHTSSCEQGEISVGIGDLVAAVGSPGGGGGGQVRPRHCDTYVPRPEGESGGTENQAMPVASSLEVGQRYYVACHFTDTQPPELDYADYFIYEEGLEAQLLDAVARQLADGMALAHPVPATSPGIGVDQIVGLPTWLWIDDAAWRPQVVQARLAGFEIAVTAAPARVEWALGEDEAARVTCGGPGTPWDPAGGDGQRTDCSYVYQFVPEAPAVTYPASATLVWDVSYTLNGQAGGDLGENATATTFDLRVTERQAVVCYDTRAEDCRPDS